MHLHNTQSTLLLSDQSVLSTVVYEGYMHHVVLNDRRTMPAYNIISFCECISKKHTLFYALLWNHTFAVEWLINLFQNVMDSRRVEISSIFSLHVLKLYNFSMSFFCRSYCSRRLRRIRKSLKFVYGNRNKYVSRKIKEETITDVRWVKTVYIYIGLTRWLPVIDS